MNKEDLQWTKRAVFICTKCHKTFPEGSLQQEGNCGENLKDYLKAEVKKLNLQSEIRVMTSSCQNICEPQTVAVYIQDLGAPPTAQAWSLHPERERDELLKCVVKD